MSGSNTASGAGSTERLDPRTRGLDSWPDAAILEALWESQAAAVASLRPALPAIAAAVAAAAARLQQAGRLLYVGAGTSGRIAVQDGAELAPTFDWPDERLALVMAGGDAAFTRGIEDAEDDETAARDAMRSVSAADVVLGIAASGGTPFTVAAIVAAREAGALTVGFANVAGAALLRAAAHPVLLDTGPEVIAGSTRLKAGTAQKAALNLFSTLLMTRLGHVHDGQMVDMRATNAKLRARAARMVADIAGCGSEVAAASLAAAGRIKPAILVAHGMTPDAALNLLDRHGGRLRDALRGMPT